jgi:hypothetical protein
MKQQLFQYAVIWHPTKEQHEAGKKSKLLVEPKTILSQSKDSAFVLASREIPEQYLDELDQVEVVLRPF